MTIIEKIITAHSELTEVKPGDIVDMVIDVRLARDFGGANVVKNLEDNNLKIADSTKTWFTFDCNPGGSDQKYAANQQTCRIYARNNDITVYDINSGIGTHLAIDKGLAYPGCTLVSTDSHANILGAIGAFGQGMGDIDIASAWASGKAWFKVPESVKIIFKGERKLGISAKDFVLNMLKQFGANSMLGYSLELYGDEIDQLSLDERITIASMATEMGAIAILIPPSEEVVSYCNSRSGKLYEPVFADADAVYAKEMEIQVSEFNTVVSKPGKPHDVVSINEVSGLKIDSVFVGSCTNGRLEDMYVVAEILRGQKIAPGIVFKIVPSTDEIWNKCLEYGWISVYKEAGALVSNPGCAGCASGQVGQNGPGEITISTGNRNFTGKQGKGDVYLASPAVAAASAVAGFITTPDEIPESPVEFEKLNAEKKPHSGNIKNEINKKPMVIEGRMWFIQEDNIDTDMIYHNRHLSVTEINEMGQYAFGNLKGWEDFSGKANPGDIIVTGENFGAGSSRQQAVDCFISLGIQAIIAYSFGAIYERNAINAGFPVLTFDSNININFKNNDYIKVDFDNGILENISNGGKMKITAFSEVQKEIYKRGGLLKN
ncbi:MAG: 3-isopropylmalate dehydratase large subunit [Prolixibacteraceae bacterium]|nr:3-isopropylmalate dehydratase large subunit [Prolixibacteraceae bacterium]